MPHTKMLGRQENKNIGHGVLDTVVCFCDALSIAVAEHE